MEKRKNVLDECGVDSTKESKKLILADKRSQFIKKAISNSRKNMELIIFLKRLIQERKSLNVLFLEKIQMKN